MIAAELVREKRQLRRMPVALHECVQILPVPCLYLLVQHLPDRGLSSARRISGGCKGQKQEGSTESYNSSFHAADYTRQGTIITLMTCRKSALPVDMGTVKKGEGFRFSLCLRASVVGFGFTPACRICPRPPCPPRGAWDGKYPACPGLPPGHRRKRRSPCPATRCKGWACPALP